MNRRRLLKQMSGLLLAMLFLLGCEVSTTVVTVVVIATPRSPMPTRIQTSPPGAPALTQIPPTGVPALIAPQGMLLFGKSTVAISGTQTIGQRDLYAIADGQVRLVAPGVYGNYTGALSPDGTMFVDCEYTDKPLRIITLDAHAGTANITTYKNPDDSASIFARYVRGFSWSPDSTNLAVRTECGVYVLALITGEFTTIENRCAGVLGLSAGPEHVAWSPDSAWLAFDVLSDRGIPVSSRYLHGDRPAGLIVASADGTVRRQLDRDGANPVWSPDGQRILYSGGWRRDDSGHIYCNEGLYVINADGNNKVRLVETTGEPDDPPWPSYYHDLDWSADGKYVFFKQEQSNQSGVICSDGTGLLMLGDETSRVSYSPQSNRIAWVTLTGGRYYEVFVSNPDGTGKQKLGEAKSLDPKISFSPCGYHVMWKVNYDEEWIVSNLEGTEQAQFPSPPVFSPDCTKVIFVKDERQIYISDVTGRDQVPVTDMLDGKIHIIGWVNPKSTR